MAGDLNPRPGVELGDVWEVTANTIKMTEQFADGKIDESVLKAISKTAQDVSVHYGNVAACADFDDPNYDQSAVTIGSDAAEAALCAAVLSPYSAEHSIRIAATTVAYDAEVYNEGAFGSPDVDLNHPHMVARRVERAFQWKLLEDIFGETSRKNKIKRKWLRWNDGYIPKLAQEIYDNRDFERMSTLADALEEAGCKDEDILNHCRKHTVHARGCWVVDLLLGKE